MIKIICEVDASLSFLLCFTLEFCMMKVRATKGLLAGLLSGTSTLNDDETHYRVDFHRLE